MYNPSCEACPLHYRAVTVCLPGEGPAPADLMIVGTFPGALEDVRGRPFVGPAGEELDRALAQAGVPRERVFITNAVKCFGGPRRKPTRTELAACSDLYLKSEIEKVKPKVILALGDLALLALTNISGVGTNRGQRFPLRPGLQTVGGEAKVIATYHSAAYLHSRDERLRQALAADIGVAWSLISGYSGERLDVRAGSLPATGPLGVDAETDIPTGALIVGTLAAADGTYQPFTAQDTLWMPDQPLVAWNAKFDLRVLGQYNVEFSNREVHDPMLMLHLLDSGRKGRYGLEQAVIDEFGQADPEWLESKHLVHGGLDIPIERLTRYCAQDATYTVRLYERFRPRLMAKPALWALYQHLVMPAMYLLMRVEQQPVPLDVDYIRALDVELEALVTDRSRQMAEMLGFETVPNFRSNRLIADILYKRLGLPVVKLTDTGAPSSDKAALMELKNLSPFVGHLLKFKRYGKLRSSYTQRWLRLMGLLPPKTGKKRREPEEDNDADAA